MIARQDLEREGRDALAELHSGRRLEVLCSLCDWRGEIVPLPEGLRWTVCPGAACGRWHCLHERGHR